MQRNDMMTNRYENDSLTIMKFSLRPLPQLMPLFSVLLFPNWFCLAVRQPCHIIYLTPLSRK